MISIAIIGLGNRGRKYANEFAKSEDTKIVAICEKNAKLLEWGRAKFDLSEQQVFQSDKEFFDKGKLADVLVVATQDRDHYFHAKNALQLGYELLLEKPVSPVLDECLEIAELASKNNLRVVVCHVLRYASFYNSIKNVIDDGKIGDIVSINDTENIGYWHFSHSYVRGNWRNEALSGPSLLAKCCHDLDMIHYLSGKKCISVFSTGNRAVFLPQNAPKDSTDYCLDPCPAAKNCPFDAKKIYLAPTRHTLPLMIVNKTLISGKAKTSLKEFKNILKTSPYGRCVYKCDNDVIENQNVALKLQDGVSANLTMTAFSKGCFRRIHISGTKGEIIGCDKDGKFRLNIFGGPSKTIKVKGSGIFSHLGGDAQIVKDFITFIKTGQKAPKLSTIDVTLESHKIAFKAEESRKSGVSIDL